MENTKVCKNCLDINTNFQPLCSYINRYIKRDSINIDR